MIARLASLVLVLTLLLSGCGVQFKTLTLDEGREEYTIDPEKAFANFGARTIYADTRGDEIWGIEEDSCKSLAFTDLSYSGSTALKLQWNASACGAWTGFGIGWSAWDPKDLSEIMETAAIRLYVRAIEGETRLPVLIFLLEDYGGVMSGAAMTAKHFQSYPITEDWVEVVVPLSEFKYKQDGIDLTNIKQMIIELQNAGSLMIDELQIVPYIPEGRPDAARSKPSITAQEVLPQLIYDDDFRTGWGIYEDECQSVGFTDEAYSGQQALAVSWNAKPECGNIQFGKSWNEWLGVDMNPVIDEAELEFMVRTDGEGVGAGEFKIGFKDYPRQKGAVSMIALDPSQVEGGVIDDQWRRATIPLDQYTWGEGGVNPGNVQTLLVDLKGRGQLYIDAIRLVRREKP